MGQYALLLHVNVRMTDEVMLAKSWVIVGCVQVMYCTAIDGSGLTHTHKLTHLCRQVLDAAAPARAVWIPCVPQCDCTPGKSGAVVQRDSCSDEMIIRLRRGGEHWRAAGGW